MRYHTHMVPSRTLRGVSMIDVVVGSALVLVIFLALIGVLRTSLLLASVAKAKAGATAVANTQMEYIRSLPYDSVGTVGGIPAGLIAQYATTTQNNIPYATRTFIEYVDDAADGSGVADSNGITTDYKRIKVSVTYTVRSKQREVALVSNYAPPSIETTTNGGTLKILVVNATGGPVAGATVQIVNASTSPTVNLTTFSDATGTVLLGGAATSTQYQVYISKAGYSSAQTYLRDTTNQNPTPGYLTVVKNVTTTSTFAIDQLGTLAVGAFYPIAATSTVDTLTDSSKLATQSSTMVSGGSLTLLNSGEYAPSGTARTVSVAPSRLAAWVSASTTISTPSGTTLAVQVADGTGALLPDAVLAGNSVGFSGTSINLSGISTTTYPSLSLIANLTTNASTTTSSLADWSINALAGPIPVSGVALTLTGTKTVGSTGAGAPIYKTIVSTTTNATGFGSLSLEWDSYSLSLAGYDVIDACYAPSFALSPGGASNNVMYLGTTNSTHQVLVTVQDSAGAVVPGATVTLSRTGFSQDATTTSCGAAYFGGLSSGTYTVTITKSGYTTTAYTNVSVSGHTFYAASFP